MDEKRHYTRDELNQLSIRDLEELLRVNGWTVSVSRLPLTSDRLLKAGLIETVLREQD